MRKTKVESTCDEVFLRNVLRHRRVLFDGCLSLLTNFMRRQSSLVELKVYAAFSYDKVGGESITQAATMASHIVVYSAETI